jgi:hypothetical protein
VRDAAAHTIPLGSVGDIAPREAACVASDESARAGNRMEYPMKQRSGTWQNRAFLFAFSVLTLLCWCPLGYGAYGQVGRVFGIPSWAVWALVWATVLFVLEWVYLFRTRLSMNDEELPSIISQLETVNTDRPSPAKGHG